ncbi:MAG: hypothetical protein KA314_04615 [Chloroflexi bacterium]|nr:hypothetical protein [Chloroflexota bacterium]
MSTIRDLMKQRQEDLAVQERREVQEHETFFNEATRLTSAVLGDLNEELHPYSTPDDCFGSQRERPHLPTALTWKINHPQYGQFYVVAEVDLAGDIDPEKETISPGVKCVYLQAHHRMNSRNGAVAITDMAGVADFFISRERAVQETKAKDRADRIRDLEYRLVGWANQKPQQVKEALQELIGLNPDQETDYRLKFARWQEGYAAWQAEQAQRAEAERVHQERKAAQQQAEDFYAWALVWWDEERVRVLEINRQAIADLQLDFDKGEFQLWEMEYAVSGRDEDGTSIIETRTAWVLSGRQDEDGNWLVWDADAQKIRPTRFFTAVTLKRWGFVNPSESPCYLDIRPKGMFPEQIRVNPALWDRQAEVQAFVDDAMLPTPPLPDPVLFGLSADRGRNIRVGFFG